ncbi:DUF998 domain-containing protein [Streptomyces sp. NPDC004667]|uniref:DUF998 domain-containing protein n=1 Tax=Streptomyces sp. NPDC004667 TaxID=3154285 RepID=UPI0033B3F98C
MRFSFSSRTSCHLASTGPTDSRWAFLAPYPVRAYLIGAGTPAAGPPTDAPAPTGSRPRHGRVCPTPFQGARRSASARHRVIGCPHGIHVTEGGQVRVRIGYSAWIVGVVQFFIVHGIVESAWARPYSWARNNISDLGNAHCALQPEPEPRYVCSPEHGLMNVSFVALGVLLVLGSVMIGGFLWRRGRAAAVARLLLAGAGAGFVLAGLAPADVNENQHVLGAVLIMAAGNVGLVLAGPGLAEDVPAPLRWSTGLLGVTAVTAFVLFLSHRYLGLGMGGMERVAALPLLFWALAIGVQGVIRRSGRRREAVPAARLSRAG